jgi:hypothetical protein
MKQLIRCDEPGASLCFKNGKLDVIQVSPSGETIFVQVLTKGVNGMEPLEGAYLVLPKDCFRADEDMPFDFLAEVRWHTRNFGVRFDNGGFNYTPDGGASFEHAHFWLMQVHSDDPALGLHGLRAEHRHTVVELRAAKAAQSRRRTGW